MTVRSLASGDLTEVQRMMSALLDDSTPYDFSSETVFVWERETGGLGGFISLSLRPWAEGCTSEPVPYIEGWWVAPDLRGAGVGAALVAAVEQWCRRRGFVELGSDVAQDNTVSLQAHAALGFEPTLRLQFFRKIVSRSAEDAV